MTRPSWLPVEITALLVSGSLGLRPAHADIDATGRWRVETYYNLPAAPIVEQWQQTGTSLQSGEGSCMWTGTIDVSTGSFSRCVLSPGHVAVRRDRRVQCGVRLPTRPRR